MRSGRGRALDEEVGGLSEVVVIIVKPMEKRSNKSHPLKVKSSKITPN